MQNVIFKFLLSVISVLLTLSVSSVKAQFVIDVRLDSACFDSVRFYSCRGYDIVQLDSIDIKGKTTFRFAFSKIPPTGIYKMVFDDKRGLDLIVDSTSFSIELSCSDFINGSSFKGSVSNAVLYDFRKFKDKIARQIIQERVQKKYLSFVNDDNKQQMLDSIDRRIDSLTDAISYYGEKLAQKYQPSFLSSVLNAMMVPRWTIFKLRNPDKKYKDEKEFLKNHFFDNLNFNDSLLIRSEVFFLAAKTYIERLSGRSTEELKATCDMILKKSSVNNAVYRHNLDNLMALFEYSPDDNVFVYLVENYYSQEFCESASEFEDIQSRVAAIKAMRTGNKVPDIEAISPEGKSVSLYKLKFKTCLIMFWSAYCEHCEEMMPGIIELYSFYKKLGFEVFAFNIDTNKTDWTTAINNYAMNWVNASDLKGGKGPIPRKFNVWHTPTFYLVDKEFRIVAVPKNLEEIKYWINTLFR